MINKALICMKALFVIRFRYKVGTTCITNIYF